MGEPTQSMRSRGSSAPHLGRIFDKLGFEHRVFAMSSTIAARSFRDVKLD
jgi:hypothetical protein